MIGLGLVRKLEALADRAKMRDIHAKTKIDYAIAQDDCIKKADECITSGVSEFMLYDTLYPPVERWDESEDHDWESEAV